MKKKTLKLVFILLIIVLLTSCINDEKTDNITVKQLQKEADYCILASTITGGICGNVEEPYPIPDTQTIEKNGKYYIEVSVVEKGEQKINKVITIIQKNKAYIEEDKMYLLFLKKSNTENNCYYIVNEPDGIIEISNARFKPLNKKLKKSIKNEIGKTYEDYSAWFMENYDDIRKYEFPLSIIDVAERSDFCITASMTDDSVKKIDNLYYTRVKVLKKSSYTIPDYITVVQKNERYLKDDNVYILFINANESDENYRITSEQDGVILIEETEKQNLKTLNDDLQEIVEKEIGSDYSAFCDWAKKFYAWQTPSE